MSTFLDSKIHEQWKPFRPEVELYPILIKNRTKVSPKNVFELGSHYGSDAEYLRSAFDIDPKNVFCFEPNPFSFEKLNSNYSQFNNLPLGLSNENTKAEFNCVMNDDGVSSTRNKIHLVNPDIRKVEVELVRMDYIINHYNIDTIDICKIDVEGCAYEVLEGFGEHLSKVQTLQVEAEMMPLFAGQKLFNDIYEFLTYNEFHMVAYFSLGVQCDSVWVKNNLFSVN